MRKFEKTNSDKDVYIPLANKSFLSSKIHYTKCLRKMYFHQLLKEHFMYTSQRANEETFHQKDIKESSKEIMKDISGTNKASFRNH